MRSIFFIVCLVMALACPLWAGEQHSMQQEDSMQDAPSGLTWGQVIILLTACGGTGTLCWQGSKKLHTMKIEPQPLEVKATPDYVTKREFEEYREEVRENFKGVHARINKNDASTAEIKGQLSVIAANQEKILNILLQRNPQ